MSLAVSLPLFSPTNGILDEIRAFDRVGKKTQCYRENGLDYYVNDFWTARQRQGNRIHEISYRACFKPQLPEFFISRLTQPGDCVYDPFMGRGTTPIQSALMQRRPAGNDINPLSVLLTRPRLAPPELRDIEDRLQDIPLTYSGALNEDFLVFFHRETLEGLYALRRWFFDREAQKQLDSVDDWIRMVAINRLTGHSSGFFSVYSLPPNQAVSLERQRKINKKRQQVPPKRDIKEIIVKKSKSLLSQPWPRLEHAPLLGVAPAEDAQHIPDQSVRLIVTSPPFLDVVQYSDDNWLRCWFAGMDSRNIPVSMHKTTEDWTKFVRACFRDFARVLVEDGVTAFEVGEVRGGKILLEHHVAEAVRGLPFEILGVLVNEQKFTKTANCWGVTNNAQGTNSNRIVILRKV